MPELNALSPANQAKAREMEERYEQEFSTSLDYEDPTSSRFDTLQDKRSYDGLAGDIDLSKGRTRKWKPFTTPEGTTRGRAIIDALHGTVKTRNIGPDLATEAYDANKLWRDSVATARRVRDN